MIDGREIEGWTPKLVKARLVEATLWVKHYGGPVGPTGVKSSMPTYKASLDDHLEEGWGLPEIAGDDAPEDKRRPLPPSAEMIEAHMDALTWVAQYVAKTHPESARLLALWVRCKVYRRDFDRAIEGKQSRSHAYRLRDRALSLISLALSARDGGP